MKRVYKGAEIVRLALLGMPRAEIARQVGSNLQCIAVVLSRARSYGEKIPRLPKGRPAWREEQVRALVARRISREVIAERLGIPDRQVATHLARLRRKGVDVPYRRIPSHAFLEAMQRRSAEQRERREW